MKLFAIYTMTLASLLQVTPAQAQDTDQRKSMRYEDQGFYQYIIQVKTTKSWQHFGFGGNLAGTYVEVARTPAVVVLNDAAKQRTWVLSSNGVAIADAKGIAFKYKGRWEVQNQPTTPPPTPKLPLSTLIYQKVGQLRTAENLPTPSWDSQIGTLCKEHSQDMANRYNGQLRLDHNGANERFQLVRRNDNLATGYAENVYCCPDGSDEEIAKRAVDAWKASAPHRANMLKRGVGFTAVGVVKKNGTVYITQFFVVTTRRPPTL